MESEWELKRKKHDGEEKVKLYLRFVQPQIILALFANDVDVDVDNNKTT